MEEAGQAPSCGLIMVKYRNIYPVKCKKLGTAVMIPLDLKNAAALFCIKQPRAKRDGVSDLVWCGDGGTCSHPSRLGLETPRVSGCGFQGRGSTEPVPRAPVRG